MTRIRETIESISAIMHIIFWCILRGKHKYVKAKPLKDGKPCIGYCIYCGKMHQE